GMKWFLTLFLSPFVVIGLGMIGAVGYFFVALFNPRPQLRANTRQVPLGGSIDLEWQIDERLQNIRELRIFLEGREETTYRRGTSTYTEKEVFVKRDITRVTDPLMMSSGTAKVILPADSMHSFSSANNKIIWVIRLEADIEWRPDLNEEFPIIVLPAPTAIANPA